MTHYFDFYLVSEDKGMILIGWTYASDVKQYLQVNSGTFPNDYAIYTGRDMNNLKRVCLVGQYR